jgi:phage I-like protein
MATKQKSPRIMDGLELFSDQPVAADRQPPAAILLMRYGKTEFTKGTERGEYEVTEDDVDKVLADFDARKRDVVIDYEHQTLSGDQAPAAGWVNRLEKVADGLMAHVKYWTDKAKGHLQAGEYRYVSPVLHTSRRHPFALHSVALTNHPATHGIPALVASDDEPDEIETALNITAKSEDKNMFEKLMKLLGLVALADTAATEKLVLDAIAGMQGAVSARDEFLKLHDAKSLDEVTGKIKGMVPAGEKAALAAKLAKIEAEKVVTQAFTDRKLVEAQRAWALGLAEKDLAAFTDFVAKQPVVAPAPAGDVGAGGQPPKGSETITLSDAELAVYRTQGLTDAQIEKIKADRKAQK